MVFLKFILLTICGLMLLYTDSSLILSLPSHTSDILNNLLQNSNQHLHKIALAIIHECSKINFNKQGKQ